MIRCSSAGEAASGGGEEAAGVSQRPAEAGRPHRAGERHKHRPRRQNNIMRVVHLCVCVCVQDSLPKQVYSMHQLLGDKQYGTERTGFLYKKSDG